MQYLIASHPLSLIFIFLFMIFSFEKSSLFPQSLPSLLGARSETSGEATVRSNLVGNAGSRPISEAKQPWACPVLGWGTTGEAHVLYSFQNFMSGNSLRCARAWSGTLGTWAFSPKSDLGRVRYSGSGSCNSNALIHYLSLIFGSI